MGAPTLPRTQDDGVGRPTISPDAAFSGDDVTGAAGSSRFPASHPAGYTTQDFASHPLHNNNPWFEGSSVRQRPYHSDYNRLDSGDTNNELQMNRMVSSISINDPNLTNDTCRLSDRPIPHYNYYDRQVGRGGTGSGGGQRDSGTLPLSPDLQRLVEDKYKETLLIFNESLAKYEGGEGGISPALLPGINFHINHLSQQIQSTLDQVREYRERGGGGQVEPQNCPSKRLQTLLTRVKDLAINLRCQASSPHLGGGGAPTGPSAGWVGVSVHGAPAPHLGGGGVPPSPLNPAQLGLSGGEITGGADARGRPVQYLRLLEDKLQKLQRDTDGIFSVNIRSDRDASEVNRRARSVLQMADDLDGDLVTELKMWKTDSDMMPM